MSVESPLLADQVPRSEERSSSGQIIPMFATVVVCLIAGTSSWLIVKPGEGLLWPLAVDALIFTSFAALCRLVTAFRGTRFGRTGVTLIFLGLAGMSLLWTYFGALPASVAFDSTDASVAHSEVARAAHDCQLVTHGSVGFLQAPYKICTFVIPKASMVEFATPDLDRGYAYLSGKDGVNWFSDECSRHLTGHWWAFATDQQAPVTGCPFGYTFEGGG